MFFLERRSHEGAGFNLDFDLVVRLGLDHDFAPVFESAGGVGTAIESGGADHDRATVRIKQKVDMPLEQPRPVGRGLPRPGRSLAALNPLLRILPDKRSEPGQYFALGAADRRLNRLAVKEQPFDLNNTEADMHGNRLEALGSRQ